MPSQKGHTADDHRDISERDRDRYDDVLRAIFNELRGTRIQTGEVSAYLGFLHKDFRDLLKLLAIQCDTGRRAVGFGFKIGLPRTKKENRMPLEITITNEQEIDVTVSPKTDTGKPAAIDGKPSWTVVSGNSQVIQSEDGKTGTLRSSDEIGDTQIIVKIDADLGDGVEEVSDIINLKVASATAKNLGLAAGTARAKPDVTIPTPVP